MLQTELVRLLLSIAIGAAAGTVLGSAPAGIACALAALFAWHGWQAARLHESLNRVAPAVATGPAGIWRAFRQQMARELARARDVERHFSEYKQDFDAVGDAFPDPLVLLNEQLAVRWSNAAAATLLGCDSNVCKNEPLQSVVRHPVLSEYLTRGNYEHAVEISAPADKARLLSIRLFPFGRRDGRLLVARDVTRAYNLDAVRRDFVVNVSHELRTPLTVIGGYLEPLGEALEHDEEWASHIDLMKQEAARMEELIRDLTTLSRLESTAQESQEECIIGMRALVDSIVSEALALSGDKLHDIRNEVPVDAALRGNEQEIRSAVSNLVFNAVKHTEPRTRIDVAWRTSGTDCRLIVRDHGDGIASRHLPRLTERFYRVDNARSRASGGTGLGLAIVKHILLRHDAELIVDSKVGVGTEFTCLFPGDRVALP